MKTRSPWPIAIAAFFAAAITFLGSFIGWAMRQRQELVSPDYYERELRFQTHLEDVDRSRQFAARHPVEYQPEKRTIVLRLPADQTGGAVGTIHLYRPADSRLDVMLPLDPDTSGTQQIDAHGLSLGLWKVRVEWSRNGQGYYLDQPVLVTAI